MSRDKLIALTLTLHRVSNILPVSYNYVHYRSILLLFVCVCVWVEGEISGSSDYYDNTCIVEPADQINRSGGGPRRRVGSRFIGDDLTAAAFVGRTEQIIRIFPAAVVCRRRPIRHLRHSAGADCLENKRRTVRRTQKRGVTVKRKRHSSILVSKRN